MTQSEPLILGIGVKMFTLAGSVIVYGVYISVVYAQINWIGTLIRKKVLPLGKTFS